MQSVNGAQFLNTICILLLSLPAANGVYVIYPLTSMYESLQSHKLDFYIEVLYLGWLLALYVPTQFFVLNLSGWFGVLSNKFIIFWYSFIIL